MPKFEVTSDRLSVGARGEVVDLDPAVVSIPALVAAGHVRQVAEQSRRRRGGEDG